MESLIDLESKVFKSYYEEDGRRYSISVYPVFCFKRMKRSTLELTFKDIVTVLTRKGSLTFTLVSNGNRIEVLEGDIVKQGLLKLITNIVKKMHKNKKAIK